MVIFELEGIEIDHCVECGGTWLDSGELELIAEFEGVEPGNLSNALRAEKTGIHSTRRCPRCNKKMDSFCLENSIELERCPYGHGLWLDKGELQAVVATFREGEEGIVAKFFGNLYQNELKLKS
jgi:Zn-finger nucleic acid-binding protein